MIVVLDTNVWISGLVFAKRFGTPTMAIEKAMSADLIATCDAIEDEILRVLVEKFSWDIGRAELALETVLARSIRVKLRGTVKQCRDPHDDKFLECAALAKANVLNRWRSRSLGSRLISGRQHHHTRSIRGW